MKAHARTRSALALALAITLPSGCGRKTPSEPQTNAERIVLTDATASSGLDFQHRNAASERKLLPETMGSGVAIFDADADGLPDVLFVDGGPLSGEGKDDTLRLRLFRNLGELRFQDATDGSGLELPFYGMGAAVGDFDGDGALDLYVTGVGGDRLFHNDGEGRFEDTTTAWGLPERGGFGSSAAFFDADADGDLDLFVGRYVDWSPEEDQSCSPDQRNRVYCTPEVYPAVENRFYRNLGDRFVDDTAEAGLALPGKTLGVVVLDVDLDGWLDLAVANDTVPNALLVNRGDGTFENTAAEAGFALGAARAARGGMGIAAGDLFADGREDVVVGNFANEMAALFHNRGEGLFEDRAATARLGMPTLLALTFGTLATDLDNDGWLDVVFANGHIEPSIDRVTGDRESFAQPLQVFRNLGGTFDQVPDIPSGRLVARGLASGDLDLDGDVDLVVTQNGGPAVLLRNDSPAHDWLRLRLRGPGANSWGLGTEVTIEFEDGASLLRRLEPSGSYLSSSEPILHVGLGGGSAAGRRVRRISVRWPGGATDTLEDPQSGTTTLVASP